MVEEVNTAEQAPEEAVETPQLSLQDMATMVQIVDICSKRGAFEGPELESVGGLRNRLVQFVNASAPKEGEAPEGEVPVVEEAPAETAED
jgi:hypothetical protein|tara:strand:+ start:3346 stop:3615 length:270 start_codon:yes stop_codon:yes gene_type:complete